MRVKLILNDLEQNIEVEERGTSAHDEEKPINIKEKKMQAKPQLHKVNVYERADHNYLSDWTFAHRLEINVTAMSKNKKMIIALNNSQILHQIIFIS